MSKNITIEICSIFPKKYVLLCGWDWVIGSFDSKKKAETFFEKNFENIKVFYPELEQLNMEDGNGNIVEVCTDERFYVIHNDLTNISFGSGTTKRGLPVVRLIDRNGTLFDYSL